jgi:hypothetical protein
MRYLMAVASLIWCTNSVAAQTLTIDFGTRAILPYTEDGVTFSAPPTFAIIAGGRLLCGSEPGGQALHAQSTTPFDLLGLNILNIYNPWRIETSAGGVYTLSGVGTQNLNGRPGFSGITYFNIINNGNFIPSLTMDDIQIAYVPEPAAGAFMILGVLAFSARRSRQLRCQTLGC